MTAATVRPASADAALRPLRERILARAALRLAHDFNNDLTVIGGHLELARRRPDDLGGRLDAMRGAGERARTRVRLVQDLGRARPGTPDAPRSDRLATDLEGVCQLLCGREIVFELEGPPHGSVDRDAQRLQLAALVLEALEEGATRMQLRVAEDAGRVLVEARFPGWQPEDDGVRERLFALAGTLGLEADEAMEDEAWSFRWRARAAARSAATAEPGGTGRRDGPVLVVDDDPTVRRIFVEALRRSGIEVLEAASGTEALALASRGPALGLLVTDANLHGSVDGPQLARRLREQDPDLAVIVVSGYAAPAGDADEFLWLQKPIPLKVFTRHVQELRGAEAPTVAA